MSGQDLRDKAEAQLKGIKSDQPLDSLLHELQVYQIELEMQNETLRQNQIQLEESRDRYLDLYDFAPVAYLTVNAVGMIIEINHTGALLLGMERKKILRRRLSQFVTAEDNERWCRCFLKMMNHDSACHDEFSFKRLNGTTFYAGVDSRFIHGVEKTVRITLTDVTERRLAEQMLRVKEQKLHGLFELCPLGIALTDMTGRYI
ncbi:PAS domain-containing protein [Gallionella capsiferriformans]|uniref:PAS sensor protein n=1 Tax=Gallionella capsiferriformans (strain ES-2) TaxID=395494 RepID=D9SFV6_GALCS|nr:PAS domain-containing protein [Gallionella capsiferriformans]ADL55403.1 PAS sensor protein [Gallionella capsiferriformans ES-2]